MSTLTKEDRNVKFHHYDLVFDDLRAIQIGLHIGSTPDMPGNFYHVTLQSLRGKSGSRKPAGARRSFMYDSWIECKDDIPNYI